MVNFAHLNVVLRKDFLILQRRRGFCLALFILPILLVMFAVIPIKLTDKGDLDNNSLFMDYIRVSGNAIVDEKSFDTTGLPPPEKMASTLKNCVAFTNNIQKPYTLIGVIAEDSNVYADAETYFKSYFLEQSGLNLLAEKLKRAPLMIEMFKSVK